ncbi:Uncharacterized protein PHSC3_001819 [Chlamydiales bacterium STE3]|nr:Uncharacterized protein PHSC3_001819 [Chlamydiales bacterium STE3]
MKMQFFSFLTILISLVVIDAVWLGLMFKRLYAPSIGHLLSDSMKLWPVLVFYLLYAFLLNFFVVIPELKVPIGYKDVLIKGMLLGLLAYGTYDLTNQATLKGWPVLLTITDMAWGSILTGAVTLIAVYFTRKCL